MAQTLRGPETRKTPRLAANVRWRGASFSEPGLTPQDGGVTTTSQFLIMDVATTVSDEVIKAARACAEQVTKLPFRPLDPKTCPGTDVCSDERLVEEFVSPVATSFSSQYWPVSGQRCFGRRPANVRDSAMIKMNSSPVDAEPSSFE